MFWMNGSTSYQMWPIRVGMLDRKDDFRFLNVQHLNRLLRLTGLMDNVVDMSPAIDHMLNLGPGRLNSSQASSYD